MKNLFYIGFLSVLLFGCGVKKGVVDKADVTTAAATAQDNIGQPEQDTLPDFLREFANDSTIHINWVYGIPFIIDDSVPMFLPPIDKNPEGYVITPIHVNNYYNNMTPETVSTIIDSIPWIKKCINKTKDFLLTHSEIAEPYHSYTYRIYLLKNALQEIIEFRVFQEPIWDCLHDPYYRSVYSYYFDNMGNILSKCARKMPYRLVYKHQWEYPIRSKLPSFSDFEVTLNTVFPKHNTLLDFSVYIEPTPCLRGDDMIFEGVKP